MKYIKIMLKILLPILLITISMSFIIENMVTKTITKDIMSKKISGYFLDNIIHDYNVDELLYIENKIRASKYTEKITSKYIETIFTNLIHNENKKLDITNEVKLIIEKELKNEISEEKKNEIYNNLQEQSINLEKRLENSLPIGFNNYNFTLFLKVYSISISLTFRIIIFLLLIANIIFLIILEKEKSLKYIQIGIIITSIISTICYILIKIFANFIDQRLFGGWIDTINANILITFIIIEVVISIIIFFIIKKINIKK